MKARLEEALHGAWQRRGLFSIVMRPLSWLYAAVASRRKEKTLRRPGAVHHDSLPVLVVGNIYVGGTGKTPVVIALVEALKQRGWRPGVVSRGYGSKAASQPQVGTGALDPLLFGDEPALIAGETGVPVAVHPDRKAAVSRLRKQYPSVDVIISDDGLQHVALGRDLEIIVQDSRGVGNGLVLPAGPLREAPDRLESADLVVTNLQAGENVPDGGIPAGHSVTMMLAPSTVEHLLTGATLAWDEWLTQYGSRDCAAVAAIGRPERFFAMLRSHGLALAAAHSLPDHYDYKQSPFAAIQADCILLTPKDAIKCGHSDDARLFCVHPVQRFSNDGWVDLIDGMLRAISDRKRTAVHAEALNSGL